MVKVYVYKSTGRIFTISDSVIDNDEIMEAPTLPPLDGFYKWDSTISDWVAISEAEIYAGVDREPTTTKNGFVMWADEFGSEFKNSMMNLHEPSETINSLYNFNLQDGSDFLINGKSITKKDRQIAIANGEESHNSDEWEVIPDLSLTSQSFYISKYEIAIEIMIWVSKNKSLIELGLFLGEELKPLDILTIEFDKNNDGKSIAWSNDYSLLPDTKVSIRWRNTEKINNTCYCSRRKLLIQEV